MKFPQAARFLPAWPNALLAVASSLLLILAFPDFEFWFLAWFGLVPLLFAIEREKGSAVRSFVVGWLWGFVFFTGTCWWLTFAPINYAGFPLPIAYLLLFCVTAVAGIFPGIFAAFLSLLLKRLGPFAFIAAPSIWVCAEFLRYWITGNNWNAIGYSQAFVDGFLFFGAYAGVAGVSFLCVAFNSSFLLSIFLLKAIGAAPLRYVLLTGVFLLPAAMYFLAEMIPVDPATIGGRRNTTVVAIQPDVPMAGLTYEKWQQLRRKHAELAESALATINDQRSTDTTVIFPESPMNFMWEEDEEFRNFVRAFAAKNDVSVLFNSAEPDGPNDKYFNSAVLIDRDGKEVAQYDKIYLLPFGESIPAPLQSIVPAFVGSFSYGKEYDLLPLGDAKAGVMICFESHFGELGREYVRDGADVLIEMTNDGYLGPTPVLRQHLANAVFRAVETNRPVLRVTNVGVTAYINERGAVLDPAESYTEATRVWPVSKSDGSQTFYVRYGDWFAWLCSIVTVVLLVISTWQRNGRVNTLTHGKT
jgi:apolipoprotein N-acyltransferase